MPVTQTDAEGYLARGKQLYEIRNYTGCIDQLRTMSQFDAPADLVEEAEYYSAMAQYRRGDGIDALRRFVAAHPASVRRADRIVILENGSIAACGTHEELLAGCKVYRDIYDSQMGEDGENDG